VAYDRFGHPQELRTRRKAGDQKIEWNKQVMAEAIKELEELGILQQVDRGK